jgi:adenine-specific DNA-methyltransferase
MRYIGSKTASLSAIEQAVSRCQLSGLKHFCDPFAGICTVSQHFKRLGYRITTGDILAQSLAFQVCTIASNQRPSFQKLLNRLKLTSHSRIPGHVKVLNYLNRLDGIEGYVSRHYSTLGNRRRKFFTCSNAQRIDAIRNKIAEWKKWNLISVKEESYLLVSLLHAADKVANTAGTYYAFLKRFNRKSRKDLYLTPVSISSNALTMNQVFQSDARQLVKEIEPDILYLDPPYNDRDYGAYYHLTESLVLWNKKKPTGRSGIPKDRAPKSDFCKVSKAEESLADLIRNARARIIVLHYAANGLVSHSRILKMLTEKGPTTYRTWSIRRYQASANAPKTCNNRLYVCKPRQR